MELKGEVVDPASVGALYWGVVATGGNIDDEPSLGLTVVSEQTSVGGNADRDVPELT